VDFVGMQSLDGVCKHIAFVENGYSVGKKSNVQFLFLFNGGFIGFVCRKGHV
jgi:hypothetical protein